jgi:hypothetical protein
VRLDLVRAVLTESPLSLLRVEAASAADAQTLQDVGKGEGVPVEFCQLLDCLVLLGGLDMSGAMDRVREVE